MTEHKHIYERDLDLWQYKMPKDSLSISDRNIANIYNIAVFSTSEADYLVGSWVAVMHFMNDYLKYDANTHDIDSLYVKRYK